jgi:hypothetical protein
LEEQDVLRANTQIAKGFAEKVLQVRDPRQRHTRCVA